MVDLDFFQKKVEEALHARLLDWEKGDPQPLFQPVIYALKGGGKRLRPVLVLLGHHLFGDHHEEAMPAALALEVFHNFTLLHDDIMDKAELRRNQPTVHIRFGENRAILSGDVMAFMAYGLLQETGSENLHELFHLFTMTAVDVCKGQQLDMDFEVREVVSTGEYLEMIRLKTAVLLACALKSGAILGGGTPEQAGLLYEAGIELGLAFQLRDDYLDTFGEEKSFGKKIGGDIAVSKKTILYTEALRLGNSVQRQELTELMSGSGEIPEHKFKKVKTLYEALGVKESALQLISRYHSRALSIMDSLEVPELRKQPLMELARKLVLRVS